MDYLSHKNRAAADLDKDVDEKMKLLQERFESCSATLADSYDKCLLYTDFGVSYHLAIFVDT